MKGKIGCKRLKRVNCKSSLVPPHLLFTFLSSANYQGTWLAQIYQRFLLSFVFWLALTNGESLQEIRERMTSFFIPLASSL